MNPKQKQIISLFVLILFGTIAGLFFLFSMVSEEPFNNRERLGVVVTIPPLEEFVEKVGGSRVNAITMVPGSVSPHTYEPTPSQMRDVGRATIYFKSGSGLEFEEAWLPKLKANSPGIKIINTSQGISIIERDPHVWTSPLNAGIMVNHIADALIAKDPEYAFYYQDNRDRYLMELDSLHTYITSRLEGYTNRAFMIYHSSFAYFEKEYGLHQISIEVDGKQPTPGVIREAIRNVELNNINYLFTSPRYAERVMRSLANELNLEIAMMDGLEKNYVSNLKQITNRLVKEFQE